MPIEIKLHNIATKTALRLYTNKCWYPDTNLGCKKSYISHARLFDKEIQPLKYYLDSPLNEQTQPQNIVRSFTISEEEISDPKLCEPEENTIQIFTDGSVIDTKEGKQAGAGIYIRKEQTDLLQKHCSLGTLATINQAEMYAICEAAAFLKNNTSQANSVKIYTDSMNSIQRLNKFDSNSKLTIETLKNIKDLQLKYKEVTLYKVRAHIEILGNETADTLAKRGAEVKPIGPEPFLYLPDSIIRHKLGTQMLNKRSKSIKESKIKISNKILLKSYLKDKPPKIAHHIKADLKNITGIISGQNHLAHHENKMDRNVIPFCKHCPGTRETTEHFMADCPAYSHIRQEIFQSTHIPLNQIIKNFNTKTICKFINRTGRMEEENKCYQN